VEEEEDDDATAKEVFSLVSKNSSPVLCRHVVMLLLTRQDAGTAPLIMHQGKVQDAKEKRKKEKNILSPFLLLSSLVG
jgi:hypothetical protein